MEQASYRSAPAVKLETDARHPAMRVCMLALVPIRRDIRLQRAARALSQAGFAVSVIDVEHDRTGACEEVPGDIHIKHILIPSRFSQYYSSTANFIPWLLFKAVRILLSTLEVLRTSADIYHASDITALPACYIAARMRRRPLIFESYELPLVDPPITRRRLLCALSTRLLRGMMSHCSGIITTSPPMGRELQRRYGGRAPIIVRNIPDYQAPVASDRLRQYLGLGPETRISLYQGYLQPDRGLDVLVRAARFLALGIVIVMLGGGPSQPEVEALIAQEGVGDRVKILPPAPHTELLEWTASADIGLAIYRASYSANVQVWMPNKLFEYLMAGLPVLASPIEAIVETVRTYEVGCIVDSIEPEEVGRAISAMLADQEALARMHQNTLAAAERELRWDVEQQQLITLYRNTLATRLS